MKNKTKSLQGRFASVALSHFQQYHIKGGTCCDGGSDIPPPPPKKTAQTNQNGG